MTIEQWLLDHKEEIIQEVQAVCRIDSLKTDAQPDAPFGPGIRDALHHTLALAERLGYRVTNFDNYAAHADLGEGEETMGILGHLDIVPVGEGWTYPPFGAEIHDGKIYARGSIDDKGPTVIAMYAAKAAQEVYGLGKKVRVILGCDEETTWLDMKHYLKRAQPLPDFAIVPDAEFPLINAEKGILQVRLEAHFAPSGVRMSAGERINVVPSMASADLPALPEDIAQRIAQYNTSEDGEIALEEGKLISRGVGAHGSMPHLGKNAAMHLIRFIAGAGLVGGEAGKAIAVLAEHPGLCKKGKRLGIAIEDQESGHLSMNPGVLRMSDTTLTLDIDIRHPVTYTSDEVVERIKKTLEGTPIAVNVLSAKRGLHIPKESALVQTLLDVYEEVTGTRPEPLAIGGGTYARALDNAVAFGPCFPERPGRAHEADEYIDIEDMMTAARIYALAIARLCAPEA